MMTDQSLQPVILVVDDDLRIREALCSLLESSGFESEAFGSVAEFLNYERPDRPACLILDLQLPDVNGLELQGQLSDHGPPIVFVTGHGDVPSSVRAMKSGAVEFLLKPIRKGELIAAVNEAIARDRAARKTHFERAELSKRYSTLTPREREVLSCVVSGLANKETAAALGNSEFTVGVQRGQVMRKMAAASLAELIRMADRLGVGGVGFP